MTFRIGGCLIAVVGLATITIGTAAESELPFREGFDDGQLQERNWYDLTKTRIAGDAAQGAGCLEYEWLKDSSSTSGSSAMRRLFEPTDQVTLSFRLKLSTDWGWTGRNYHPHLIHFLTTANSQWHGPAASHLTLYVEPVNGKLRLAAQDIQNKEMPHGLTQGPLKGGYNGRFYDSQQILFNDDKWHTVEAYFKLNSLDLRDGHARSDGIARGWFDGKLVVDRTDIILRSVDFPDMKFNQILLAPYFGPGLLPRAQKLWIDALVVGRNRDQSPANSAKPAGSALQDEERQDGFSRSGWTVRAGISEPLSRSLSP